MNRRDLETLSFAKVVIEAQRSPDGAKRNPGPIEPDAVAPECAEPVIGGRLAPARRLPPGLENR